MRLFCLLLCCFCVSALAGTDDLYQASVPVTDQQADTRHAAFKTALAEVLVKVSGNKAVMSVPGVAARVQNATGLVQQYSYEGEGESLCLNADFDETAVKELLASHGQTVWGRRPLILVWLGMNDYVGPRILTDSDGQLDKALQFAGHKRGLKLQLPLLDLQDLTHVRIQDIWAPNPYHIRQASERYGAHWSLVGKLSEGAENWMGEWRLISDDGMESWTSRGETEALMVEAAIDQLTDLLAGRFATLNVPHAEENIEVVVEGLEDMSHYARVLDYLQGLNGVARVEVLQIQGGAVHFHLQLTGGLDNFEQTISLDQVLVAEGAHMDDGLMYYHLTA